MSDFSSEEVTQHLEEVLSSAVFRSSQRSCQFLRFVVESVVTGQAERLKERAVGEKIFGRAPDYDTGQDSIVRVKAGEVRRRLAQYYEQHPEAPIRIELPHGAYKPVFHRITPGLGEAPTAPAPPQPQPRKRWQVAFAILLFAAVVIAVAGWRISQRSLFQIYWEPFLSSRENPILCVPTPEAYRIYGEADDKQALIEALQPRTPQSPTPAMSKAAQQAMIVSEPGEFLGIGDARSLALLYGFFQSRGRTPQIRMGSDTSFSELRTRPDLLIGGFTNSWTLDLLKDARFVFRSNGPIYGIRDTRTGKLVCQKPAPWEPRGDEDCAIVSRLVNSKTGHPLLIAAGLDHFGTLEAGEFLTRPDLLEPALRSLRAGWQNKNLQILFRVEVVRDNVSPPQVLATHVW